MKTEIKPILAFYDNYIWAIITNNNCSIVDPGSSEPVLKFLQEHKLKLKNILITHHHSDHTGGINKLLSLFPDLNIYGPNNNSIENINNRVKEHDTIDLDIHQMSFKVIETPGHTLDHIIFYDKDNETLFSGDTLFAAGCGRLFEGTAQQMLHSLSKIKQLNPATKIYPAHEYTLNNLKFALVADNKNKFIQNKLEIVKNLRANQNPTLPTTLTEELMSNPFLRTNKPALKEFVSAIYRKNINSEIELFAILRKCKDNF